MLRRRPSPLNRTVVGKCCQLFSRGPQSHPKRRLLCIARDAIHTHLTTGEAFVHPPEDGELGDLRATFVTLRNRTTRNLCGCRGEYRATRPLAQAVVHTAVSAATDDPRFPSLTLDELSETHIEISVLTPMVPIAPRKIEIGRHGLLLTKDGSAGPHDPRGAS